MTRPTAPPVDVARTPDSVAPHRTRRADLYAALSRNAAEQARLYAELAAIEAGEAGAQPAPVSSAGAMYATAEHNPLGTARGFLNAHRRGAFPTFKQGRTIAARWSDVEAWMTDPARRAKAQPANDLDAMLAQAASAPRRRARGAGDR